MTYTYRLLVTYWHVNYLIVSSKMKQYQVYPGRTVLEDLGVPRRTSTLLATEITAHFPIRRGNRLGTRISGDRTQAQL